jgi:molybdenum cofactor cytidylyltransferase
LNSANENAGGLNSQIKSRLDADAGLPQKRWVTTFHPGVVILGAGASSRMGRPKLLLPWKGTTVIGHLITQWRQLGATQITVVLRPHDIALVQELDRLDFSPANQIPNPQPERGMFSSIVCAAEWPGWKREISHIATTLGDQPHLKQETLRLLLKSAAEKPDAICQPELHGREKHPVILPRGAFSALKDTRTESFKQFLETADFPHVRCVMEDAGLDFDLDTPEDFARLKKLND